MDEEKEKLFKQLQAEINQSILEIEQGIYFTREDLVKRYGLEKRVWDNSLLSSKKQRICRCFFAWLR